MFHSKFVDMFMVYFRNIFMCLGLYFQWSISYVYRYKTEK